MLTCCLIPSLNVWTKLHKLLTRNLQNVLEVPNIQKKIKEVIENLKIEKDHSKPSSGVDHKTKNLKVSVKKLRFHEHDSRIM